MSDVENMLRYHLQGLQRVCRIIDGNSNYDALMEHRLGDSQWAKLQTTSDIEEKRKEAVALFEQKFRKGRPKAIVPEFEGMACEGSSANNIREFQFFERICASQNISILKKNYSDCVAVSVPKLTYEQERARETISADIQSFYDQRDDITASIVHQQALYSQTFFSFLLAFTREGAVRPSAIVQANDHSPVRVALSMVMKGLGIPRVYLQHAEVTPIFPELDFEYSVLRNAQSYETYATLGCIEGEVFVIARDETVFAQERLFRIAADEVPVVIYPSSRVLIDELVQLIANLKKNPQVSKIAIKQHPAAAGALNDLLRQSGVEFPENIPDEDHIAIVGNSAVVIELLHRGIPVYQNFEFDPIGDDYYGFASSGLTYRCELSDVSRKFWQSYPPVEDWINKFAKWDPTAGPGNLEERTRFTDAMVRLNVIRHGIKGPRSVVIGRRRARAKAIAKRAVLVAINCSPRVSAFVANKALTVGDRMARFLLINTHKAVRFFQRNTDLKIKAPVWQSNIDGATMTLPPGNLVEMLEYTLATVEKPWQWLQENARTEAFTALAIISAFDRMFQNRNPRLNLIFGDSSTCEVNSPVNAWLYLKRAEWGNFTVSNGDFDQLCRFIYGYEDDARVRAMLEQMLLAAIIRCGTCELLDSFWLNAKAGAEGLSINKRIDLLRKLRTEPGRQLEAEQLRQLFEKNSSPFELLKLRNMDFLEGRQKAAWTHLAAERDFLSAAPRRVAREFDTHIAPIYEALRPGMRYMEVRINQFQANELVAQMGQALSQRKPFSLIRLSDGEGYLFPERRFFTDEDIANRERHWWGLELPADLRAQIITEARDAILHADVVGIPSIFRFIRDTGDHSVSLLNSLQGRGLVEVLAGTKGATSASAALTEDKVNVALFSAIGAVSALTRISSKVILVTSARPDRLPRALVTIPNLSVISVPTHHKTALNEAYHVGAKPLPLVYPSIIEDLDAALEPGALVLVAGGLVGKIFLGRARARGAVAIDIGHTFDDWMHPQLSSLR